MTIGGIKGANGVEQGECKAEENGKVIITRIVGVRTCEKRTESNLMTV